MTPPATAAARSLHTPTPTRRPARRPQHAPRRAVRPAAAAATAMPAGMGAGTLTAPAPLAFRLADRARRVQDAPILDRLIRGRGWIALVALMLGGLVFLQVSLLGLNTGISHAVQSAQNLERANQELRNRNAALDANGRVEELAVREGMVMPAAGDVRYLRASDATAERAAKNLSAPDPVVQQPAAQTAVVAQTPQPIPSPAATQQAAPVQQQAAPVQPQTAPVQQQPVQQAAPVQQPAAQPVTATTAAVANGAAVAP